jgi:hypothetical protein
MALNPLALELYVYLPHRDLIMRDAVPSRADPPAVGRLAEQFVSKRAHLYENRSDSSALLVARCAGLLIYAMDGYGLTFEEVCGVASYEVATVVAEITPDNRMTEPTRHLKLRESLGLASEVGQLVKLAEIAAFARKLFQELTPDDYARYGAPLKHVIDRHGQLIQAMSRLLGHGAALALAESVREALARIAHGIDGARAGRALRADAAGT